MLLLLVVVVSRKERRTFGLTIIIVSFSSCTLSLLFSLCYFCLVVVVVIEQRRGKLWGRSEKFGGKILSKKLLKVLMSIKIFHLQFYFSDDSVTPLEQLLLDVD